MASDETCWTLIHAAAAGDRESRERFSRLYEPFARAYLAARWHRSPSAAALEDAVQDAFFECFKDGGVLDRVAAAPPDAFRAFFRGVLRNIARRYESTRTGEPLLDEHAADDTGPPLAFERAWARALLREAARVQAESAAAAGPRAVQRVELLRLRFQDGLPIREIATRWDADPAWVHHEYATARNEFRSALLAVVAFHAPGSSAPELDDTCRELLATLQS